MPSESADARVACKKAYTSRRPPVGMSPDLEYYNTIIWDNLDFHGQVHFETVKGDGRAARGSIAQTVAGCWGRGRTVYNAGKSYMVTTRNHGQSQSAGALFSNFEAEEKRKVSENLYGIFIVQHDEMDHEPKKSQALYGGRMGEMDDSEGDEMFRQFINTEQCADFGCPR